MASAPAIDLQKNQTEQPPVAPLLIGDHMQAFNAKHGELHGVAPTEFTRMLAVVILGTVDTQIKFLDKQVFSIGVKAIAEEIWQAHGACDFQTGWRQTLFEVIKEQHPDAFCSSEGKPITHLSPFTVTIGLR